MAVSLSATMRLLRPSLGGKLLTHIKSSRGFVLRRKLKLAEISTGVARQMPFNFSDRMLGQILVYFGNDGSFDIGMEYFS
jgi:hypothetical protein